MDYLIYGSGIYAGVLRHILSASEKKFAGYIDDYKDGPEVAGNYQETKKRFPPESTSIIIGIGYKHFAQRWKIYQKVIRDGYQVPKLIHPNAITVDNELIGAGTVVMAGAIVDANSNVGELCVIWPGACINHDSQIGNNTFISPNSTICGCVKVGQSVFIGAGAVVADHVSVKENSFIKAGALVTKSTIINNRNDELF